MGDHIRPIYDEPDVRKKEELDEGIEGKIDLSKLLDEVRAKKDESDQIDWPEEEELSETESDEDDDRGKFHHEVENEVRMKCKMLVERTSQYDTISLYRARRKLISLLGSHILFR